MTFSDGPQARTDARPLSQRAARGLAGAVASLGLSMGYMALGAALHHRNKPRDTARDEKRKRERQNRRAGRNAARR